MNIKSEDSPLYTVTPSQMDDDAVIARALEILNGRMLRGDVFANPQDAKAYFMTRIAQLEREVFCVMFLDTQHRMIETRELFAGTIDAASVYPREVVKAALELNASAVILAHNHPSGTPEPSEADKRITLRLRDALMLVDVRTLDHMVVGLSGSVSFAERGLL